MGIWTLAVLTGLGGGVARDVPAGDHRRAPSRLENLTGPTAAAAVVSSSIPQFGALRRTVDVLDAFGVALFAATGAPLAVDAGTSPFAAALIGVTTGLGGGILRDILVNEVPLLLQGGRWSRSLRSRVPRSPSPRRGGRSQDRALVLGVAGGLRLPGRRHVAELVRAEGPDDAWGLFADGGDGDDASPPLCRLHLGPGAVPRADRRRPARRSCRGRGHPRLRRVVAVVADSKAGARRDEYRVADCVR